MKELSFIRINEKSIDLDSYLSKENKLLDPTFQEICHFDLLQEIVSSSASFAKTPVGYFAKLIDANTKAVQ